MDENEHVVIEHPADEQLPVEPQAPADTFDFDTTWNAYDEPTRQGISSRLYDEFNGQIQAQYGDILPAIADVSQNPQWRNALKAFAESPELRSFIAEGGTLEQIQAMQKDADYRDFLFNDARQAYQKYQPAQSQTAPVDPLQQRIEQLEGKMSAERDDREVQGYVQSRQAEAKALFAAAPALAANRQLAEHIIGQAEKDFMNAAAFKGVDLNSKHWAAEALRRGVQPPQYIQTYQRYQQLSSAAPPPAAPVGTSAPAERAYQRRAKPQAAPRSGVEAQNRQNKLSKPELKAKFLREYAQMKSKG